MVRDNEMNRINKRCKKLESMGFVCVHRDSNVTHPNAPDVVFDFSATAEESFLSEALTITFCAAKKLGANEVRRKFTRLMREEE